MRIGAICIVFIAVFFSGEAQGESINYPTPPGIEPSTDYAVSADGQAVFVHRTPAFSFATFAITGKARIAVRVNRPIKRAIVRPLSLGIAAVEKSGTLSFTLDHPCNIAIEVDEDLRRPLFLFANAPDPKAPHASSRQVRYFAGGKVHEAGRITLGDGDTLYIAGGAIVRGDVRATGARGIHICGPGILDASQRTRQSKLIELDACKNVELRDLIVLGSTGWSVVPHRCEDVIASNVKVLSWRDNDDGFDPDSSRRVRIEDCFFRTKDDCIAVKAHAAPEGQKHALPPDAFNTEDITVTRSTFWSSDWGHALTVGFAVGAPVIRNVVIRDCDIIKKERGPAMSIDNHDLGHVENVRFESIRVEDGCDKLLELKVAFSEYSADCPRDYFRNNPDRKPHEGDEWERINREKATTTRGSIQGIVFKNIRIGGDRVPASNIRGFSFRNEISDVLIQDVQFQGRALVSPDEMNLRIRNATSVRVESAKP